MQNPFKPTAGARPPVLIGRQEILDDFAESIENGPGAPGLLSIFTGPRGIGKTVMLNEVEDVAVQAGWMVISETATPALLGRIAEAVRIADEESGSGPAGRRITAVTIGPVGVEAQLPAERQVHWRRQATSLLERLAGQGTGLLFTVDEIHAVDRAELAELAAVVQHLIREGLPVALAMAGLPKAVSDLLDEGVSTFLRRSERYDLHRSSVGEVRSSLAETFAETGFAVSDRQLDDLAEATGGYPFLIQLVGYQVWRRAARSGNRVDDALLTEGVAAAQKRMGATVLQAAYGSLSEIDRTFILRMAEDDGPSRTSDIAARMGATAQYAGVYRKRLIDAGIVEPGRYGEVDFAVPRMREFLRGQPGFGVHLSPPNR